MLPCLKGQLGDLAPHRALAGPALAPLAERGLWGLAPNSDTCCNIRHSISHLIRPRYTLTKLSRIREAAESIALGQNTIGWFSRFGVAASVKQFRKQKMSGFKPTQIRKPSNEQDFEKLIGVLFRALLKDPNVKRAGRRGQKQKGIDLIGHRNGNAKKVVGIQCKLKGQGRLLKEDEVKAEVGAALKFRRKLTEYFIVTTAEDDIKLDELATELAAKAAQKGHKIKISVWGWGTLEERINEHDEVREAFDPGFSPGLKVVREKIDAVLANQKASNQIATAQSARLDALAPQSVKLPTPWADRELEHSFLRAMRRRGFGEANWLEEISELANKAIDGELSLASNAIRANVVGRAARANANEENKERALYYQSVVLKIDSKYRDPVCEGLMLDANGKTELAIQVLRSVNSPDAINAACILIARTNGYQAVFAWLSAEGLSISNLNPQGALTYLVKKAEADEFDEALREAGSLPAAHFTECPCLHLIKGQLTLASILPSDQKHWVFAGLGLNPRYFQFASDLASKSKLGQARQEFSQVLAQASELGLTIFFDVLEEIDLWLRLEEPSTRDAALEALKSDLSDPSRTLKRVRLALAYKIPFNQEALERQLRVRKETGGWASDDSFAAFLLAYYAKDPAKTAAFFDENRDELARGGHLNQQIVAGVEIEALARSQRLDEARARLEEARPILALKQIDELLSVIEGVEKGDEFERLKSQYDTEPDLATLRVLVGLAARKQDNRNLALYAPELVKATKQIDDFRLAVGALYNERQYEKVIAVCEELPALYGLDLEFKSVKAWTHFQLGQLMIARSLARELFDQRGERNDRELAINTAIETGDWGYLQALVTRELGKIESLDSQTLVRMSRLAMEAGSPYSDQFRDAAIRRFPDDPNVYLSAYSMALDRGIEQVDEHSHEWLHMAISLSGGDGPVKTVSLKEVVDLGKGWGERVENVAQMVADNQIPLFLASRGLRRQPADMMLGQALRNQSQTNPSAQVPVLAFAGSRQRIEFDGVRNIALDPTALFTLEYLGLQNTIISMFDRVIVAPTTLSSLFVQRQFTKVNQPSQAKKAERILNLIASKKLKVLPKLPAAPATLRREVGEELADMLVAAPSDAATVVRSAPVHKVGSLLEENADLKDHESVLADTLAVLSFLSTANVIDEATKENAKVYLSHVDKGHPASQTISKESKVYLDQLSVNYLDHVNLLKPLTDSLAGVFVPSSVESDALNTVKYAEFANDLVSAIDRIAASANKAIESGKIAFCRHRLKDDGADDDEEDISQFPSLDLLSDLSSSDLVVVDDRFLNKDAKWTDRTGSIPSATTIDLLVTARKRGNLGDDAYWRALHKLRQAGYCFVPVEAQELLRYVCSASTGPDGILTESPELCAIRENISLPKRANVFRSTDNPWLLSVRFAFVHALRELWSRVPAPEALESRADWLLHCLPKPLDWCVDPSDQGAWEIAVQQAVGQYGLCAFFFGGNTKTRLRYADWIDERLYKPLEASFPWLMDHVTDFTKEYIRRLVEVEDEEA